MKLPIISAKDLCKFLERLGFKELRQKGSHKFFKHSDGRTTVVPIHSGKKIKRGLLKGILNEIRISRDEFFEKFS